MQERKILKSGRELKMQMASFAIAARLRKVVANELKGVKLGESFKVSASAKPADLMGMDLPIEALKDLLCQFLASDAVEVAIAECMACCQYNGEKITRDTFEPEDARGDYLPIAWEVALLNLTPFFKGIDLKSFLPAPTTSSSPKS